MKRHKVHLEGELGGDLQAAWTAAAQEGVSNTHVSRRGQVQRARRGSVRVDPLLRRIRNEIGQVRVGKVRMVQDVIPLKAKLHVQPFGKLGSLKK